MAKIATKATILIDGRSYDIKEISYDPEPIAGEVHVLRTWVPPTSPVPEIKGTIGAWREFQDCKVDFLAFTPADRNDILSLEPKMPTPNPEPVLKTYVAVLPGHLQSGQTLSGYAFRAEGDDLKLEDTESDDWTLVVVTYEPEHLVDTGKLAWIDGSQHEVYEVKEGDPV